VSDKRGEVDNAQLKLLAASCHSIYHILYSDCGCARNFDLFASNWRRGCLVKERCRHQPATGSSRWSLVG
jgi:hypothetical protein